MVNVNSKGNALTPGLQVNICGCEHKQRHGCDDNECEQYFVYFRDANPVKQTKSCWVKNRCDDRQPAENNKERLRNPVVCDGGGKNHRNPRNPKEASTTSENAMRRPPSSFNLCVNLCISFICYF